MDRQSDHSDLTMGQRKALKHLEACARRGETVRGYARRHRLSEQALYQATKVLRRKGVLPPSRRSAKPAATKRRGVARPPRFVEVEASEALVGSPLSPWRARFPNGVVLEGTSDLGYVVATLARL